MKFPFVFNVGEALGEILALSRLIFRKVSLMTQEIDDLNAALGDLTTAVTANNTEINTLATELAASSANGDHDAVETAVAKIKALTAASQAALAAVTPPTPTSTGITVDPAFSFPPAVVGQSYSATIPFVGGTGPYQLSGDQIGIAANGLIVDFSGNVTGTEVAAGGATLAFTVTDSLGATADLTVIIGG